MDKPKTISKREFLLTHLGKYKFKFIVPILCMIVLAIVTPFAYYLSKLIIDEVLPLHDIKPYQVPLEYAEFSMAHVMHMDWYKFLPHKLFNYLFEPWMGEKWYKIIGAIIIPVFFVKSLFTYIRSWLIQNIGNSIICDFQRSLYEHFLRLPIQYFDQSHSGEISSRIISDVYRIQEIVTDIILQIFQQSLLILGTLIFLILISVKLTLISLIGVPLALAPIIITGKYLKKKSRKAQEETAVVNTHVFESMGAIKIIKLFQKESHETNRFNQTLNRLLGTLFKTSKMGSLSSPLVEFLSTFIVTMFVGYGCYLIETKQMLAGDFIAFIVLVYSLYEPLKRLGRMNNKIANGSAALERIIETLQIKPEEDKGQLNQLTFNEKLSFENITFAYEKEPVLQNITFSAKKGETIAIVGPSGSGKTTLVNLIPSFYKITEGDIKIDGRSIQDYKLKCIREMISMVSQEILLFHESIAYNISYSHDKATKEEIISAAKRANAHDFILEQENGYDTLVGERGAKLSGGQRQRISIARALLTDKPILILDEATSALDVHSEKIIQEALNELMKNRTTFVVAHRLSTIKNADKIIVMNHGKIDSIGTHEELLAQKGLYSNLYESFSK